MFVKLKCSTLFSVRRILDEEIPEAADPRVVHDALRQARARFRQILRQGFRFCPGTVRRA